MAKQLTEVINNQVSDKAIGRTFVFKINGVDLTAYMKTWTLSFDKSFGSAVADFTLNNNASNFSVDGEAEIKVGDVVELIESFTGDSTEFKKFYGLVEQRSVIKKPATRDIKLKCLDYISVPKNWNINQTIEGASVHVASEDLEPVFLPEPQDAMAQLFNFC